jgi:hypothetical protein
MAMTTPPVTIGQDEPVTHAARLMYGRRVKRLPVIGPGGRLVGIVTRSDVLSVYSRPDEEISREISQDVILGRFLCDPARFTVTVNGSPTRQPSAILRTRCSEQARRCRTPTQRPPPGSSVPASGSGLRFTLSYVRGQISGFYLHNVG